MKRHYALIGNVIIIGRSFLLKYKFHIGFNIYFVQPGVSTKPGKNKQKYQWLLYIFSKLEVGGESEEAPKLEF